jgi:hypothetical protein
MTASCLLWRSRASAGVYPRKAKHLKAHSYSKIVSPWRLSQDCICDETRRFGHRLAEQGRKHGVVCQWSRRPSIFSAKRATLRFPTRVGRHLSKREGNAAEDLQARATSDPHKARAQ